MFHSRETDELPRNPFDPEPEIDEPSISSDAENVSIRIGDQECTSQTDDIEPNSGITGIKECILYSIYIIAVMIRNDSQHH